MIETKVETSHLYYASYLMSLGFELVEVKFKDEKHLCYVLENHDKEFHDFYVARHAKSSKRNFKRLEEYSRLILAEVVILLQQQKIEN